MIVSLSSLSYNDTIPGAFIELKLIDVETFSKKVKVIGSSFIYPRKFPFRTFVQIHDQRHHSITV